ncbi:hypothetical protein L3Y34_015051 [Caenorhabditis briggsae]|uniref:F-box domain-containing protein n=1 Tax=Caenorhabditis briggsae TaxID=6238 RepID=A0AAE9DSK0_CAEBR|nr:hypothetical protein L3Y34_015051 [Caenorhabditis briggsae]
MTASLGEKKTETKNLEEEEEHIIDEDKAENSSLPKFPLESLPDVFLQHLHPFLKWSSLRSLSQVNSRFRTHYECHLNEAYSLSIKGQVSVGVGDLDSEQSVSYLSEFYTVRCELDDEMVVEWTLKLESGIRTVVHTQYDGEETMESTRSVSLSSRDYLEKILKWILQKYQFKNIHLGVSGLAPLFDIYKFKVDDVGVSDEVDSLNLAEKLSPKKLTLFPANQLIYKKGTLDLSKLPRLVDLRMYGVPLDLDQVGESKLLMVVADTVLGDKIKLRHVKKIVQNWKSGASAYKRIEIICSSFRFPTYKPHEQWFELQENDLEELYDHIPNPQGKFASLSYSLRRLEFTVWEKNKKNQPSSWLGYY